jgi:hypothetical protein
MLTADDVPEVGDVIDIRKCAGDKYVAAAGNRQLRRRWRRHRDRRGFRANRMVRCASGITLSRLKPRPVKRPGPLATGPTCQ